MYIFANKNIYKYLLARYTGSIISPWMRPSRTILNIILKNIRKSSLVANAVTKMPRKVLRPAGQNK